VRQDPWRDPSIRGILKPSHLHLEPRLPELFPHTLSSIITIIRIFGFVVVVVVLVVLVVICLYPVQLSSVPKEDKP